MFFSILQESPNVIHQILLGRVIARAVAVVQIHAGYSRVDVAQMTNAAVNLYVIPMQTMFVAEVLLLHRNVVKLKVLAMYSLICLLFQKHF